MDSPKTIIEIQYFPSIAWLAYGMKHGAFWIDVSENYNKRSLRNKTILTQSKQIVVLSIPLKKGKHSGTNIKQVEIFHDENWQLNHIKSIQSHYGKSPYFAHYINDVMNLIQSSEKNLVKFNINIVNRMIELFDLDIRIDWQNDFLKTSDSEYFVMRDQIRFSKEYTKVEELINQQIASLEGTHHLPFVPTARSSALDLLFHLGPESRLFLKKLLRR